MGYQKLNMTLSEIPQHEIEKEILKVCIIVIPNELQKYKQIFGTEVIPPIIDNRRKDLFSIIDRAYSGYGNTDWYPPPFERVFYLLETVIINHPLENGNK